MRQPWRMARSYLRDTFNEQIPEKFDGFPGVSDKQLALVDAMISRRLQSVETSSCGRLFDAVAALTRIATEVTFEGQGAIALETAAAQGIDRRYEFTLQESIEEGHPLILDFRPMIAAIVEELSHGNATGEISPAFTTHWQWASWKCAAASARATK